MKTLNPIILVVMIFALFSSCKKDKSSDQTQNTGDNYTSVAAFHASNGVKTQTFAIDGVSGGQFSTPQGTKVTIPSNAFVSQGGNPVTGAVTIEFKDIYKRSDMLLSDRSTNSLYGMPIKSGGMFFIKAKQNNAVVSMAAGKKITIEQPLIGLPVDTAMKAMIWGMNPDGKGWVVTTADSLDCNLTGYIFSLYQFNAPVDSGSWCNSDNPTFFKDYTITVLTLNPLDNPDDFKTEVFLIFSNINSMVHVYYSAPAFPYYFAPLSLQCTVVALGVKNGKLYSSFTPVTISANLTVNFSLAATTSTEFKAKLDSIQ